MRQTRLIGLCVLVLLVATFAAVPVAANIEIQWTLSEDGQWYSSILN